MCDAGLRMQLVDEMFLCDSVSAVSESAKTSNSATYMLLLALTVHGITEGMCGLCALNNEFYLLIVS